MKDRYLLSAHRDIHAHRIAPKARSPLVHKPGHGTLHRTATRHHLSQRNLPRRPPSVPWLPQAEPDPTSAAITPEKNLHAPLAPRPSHPFTPAIKVPPLAPRFSPVCPTFISRGGLQLGRLFGRRPGASPKSRDGRPSENSFHKEPTIVQQAAILGSLPLAALGKQRWRVEWETENSPPSAAMCRHPCQIRIACMRQY